MRERSIVGLAARDALHFVDREEFARLRMLREELVAARVVATVVVPRDDEEIAAHAFAARRGEPVGPAALDQLDEAETVGRQVSADVEEYVQDNPWKVIGIVALAGLVIGALIARR